MRKPCRECRALLPGYINRELTSKQRARVSRHLSACADCYVAYIQHRQLVQELVVSVPRIGSTLAAANPPRLDKIRAAVLAEIAAPHHTPAKPKLRLDQARYSLAALLLMMAVLLPWSIRGHSFTLPTPPQPETQMPQGTEVAYAELPTETVTLTATLQANYAPQPGATQAP